MAKTGDLVPSLRRSYYADLSDASSASAGGSLCIARDLPFVLRGAVSHYSRLTATMIWLFLAAFVFGAGLLAMSTLGVGNGDGDLTDGSVHDVGLLAVFSLRNLTWASLAFGGIGVLAVLTQQSASTTLTASISAGVVTLIGVHTIFQMLRRSEAGDLPADAQVFGLDAQLVLPFNTDGVGLIAFRANGQLHELPARRARDVAELDSVHFATCRVEGIENGIAIVHPSSH